MPIESECPILFFDTECPFCSYWVQWLLRHDGGLYKIARPQGQYYEQCRQDYEEVRSFGDSVLVLYQGRIYQKSDAVLLILSHCGIGYARLAKFLSLTPKLIRDFVYDKVAKHRLAFMKNKHCLLPDAERWMN